MNALSNKKRAGLNRHNAAYNPLLRMAGRTVSTGNSSRAVKADARPTQICSWIITRNGMKEKSNRVR